ncbi:hypothetical protein J3R30DRAFT_3404843 [Lentinula aciculospora]|uniref:Uncharacterized protein n=1 Tax=Lentinula aciculospora TaxID=153920 RepID=A0A9W9AA56_9AGAR|nr:hypothetical protein J3R30DRAFT_3404843 [Lentinula aciculospora]
MSLFLLRPAVFLLATACAYPGPAHAEVASHNGMVFGPDSDGVHPHLPKAVIAAIVIAVVFVIILLVLLLLWRRQVRATTDDSASSLFDFVPAVKRQSSSNLSESLSRPSSPRSSVTTMVGSQSALNEKESQSYLHHGSNGPEADLEGSVETLTA